MIKLGVFRVMAIGGIVIVGSALTGCPGPTQSLGPNNEPSQLLSSDQVDTAMGAEESSSFETLDFGGATADNEAPNFGELAILYEAISLDNIPADPELVPDQVPGGDHGVLRGRFLTDVEGADSFDSSGIFRGRWRNASETLSGVFRGEFHPRALEGPGPHAAKAEYEHPEHVTAAGVFHGKFIDSEGAFHGILRGRYFRLSDGRSFFAGKLLGRHGEVRGGLRGRWQDLEGHNGGILEGHWATFPFDPPGDPLEYEFEPDDFGGLTTDNEHAFFGEDPELYRPLLPEGPSEDMGPRLEERPCPHGLLGGRFQGDNGGISDVDPGVFRGRWVSVPPELRGLIRGHYAPLPEGNGGVFYGKIIASGENNPEAAGRFVGFLRGRYGRLPDGREVFKGKWYNRALEEAGSVGGIWHDIPEHAAGIFKGHWVRNCNPPGEHEPTIPQ